MDVLNYRVSLDMFDALSQTVIKAKKGDSSCTINITLTKDGKIFKIGEGCRATFNAKKSDGNFIYDNCTIENDTIVYNFSSSIDENDVCQVSAIEGNVDCEVSLYNSNNEQLTSPRFTLFIDDVIYNGEEINSSPEADVLRGLVKEASDLIDEVEEKLADGITAYDRAVANGFKGTEIEWLESLKGEAGYSVYLNNSSSVGTMMVDISPIKTKYGKDVRPNEIIIMNNTLLRVLSKQSEDIAICSVLGSIKGEKGDPFRYEDFTPEQKEEIVERVCGAVPEEYLNVFNNFVFVSEVAL